MTNVKETIEVLTVSTDELAAKLRNNDDFEFWNVLTSDYYGGENIGGSRHVPLDQIGREAKELNLPKEREIVVYCAGPECPQSASAFDKLVTLGYTNVRAYEGGLEEWKAAGYQVVTDAPATGKQGFATSGATCH